MKFMVNSRRLIVVNHARPKLGLRPAALALIFSLAYAWSIVSHATIKRNMANSKPTCVRGQISADPVELSGDGVDFVYFGHLVHIVWLDIAVSRFPQENVEPCHTPVNKGVAAAWLRVAGQIVCVGNKLRTCEHLWDVSFHPDAETGRAAMQGLRRTYL